MGNIEGGLVLTVGGGPPPTPSALLLLIKLVELTYKNNVLSLIKNITEI